MHIHGYTNLYEVTEMWRMPDGKGAERFAEIPLEGDPEEIQSLRQAVTDWMQRSK